MASTIRKFKKSVLQRQSHVNLLALAIIIGVRTTAISGRFRSDRIQMDSRDSHILLSDSESFHPNRPTPPPLRSISPMTESPAPSPVRLRTFETESECSLSQLAAATAAAADRSPSRLVCVIQPRVQPNLPPETQRLLQTQRARASMRSPAQWSDRERTHSKSYPVSKRVYVPPKPLPEEECPSSEDRYCQCSPRAAGPLMSPSKSHSVFGFGANFRTASASGTNSFNEDCSRNAGWTMTAGGALESRGGLESRSYTLPPPTRRGSGVGALARSHSGSKTGPRAHTRTSAAHRSLPREQHAAARECPPPTPSGRSRGARASESDGADMCARGDGDGEHDGESESCALNSALGPPPPPPEVRPQRALKYTASRRSLSDLEARRIYQPVARTVSIDLSPARNDDTSTSTCRRRAPHQTRHPCFLAQRCAPHLTSNN